MKITTADGIVLDTPDVTFSGYAQFGSIRLEQSAAGSGGTAHETLDVTGVSSVGRQSAIGIDFYPSTSDCFVATSAVWTFNRSVVLNESVFIGGAVTLDDVFTLNSGHLNLPGTAAQLVRGDGTYGTLGSAAAADTGDFATTAQGALADSAVQPGDLGSMASEDDAPSDGTGYVRKDGAWAVETAGALTGFTVSYDTALGVDAMPSLSSPGTTSNTALGYQALYSMVASVTLAGRYNVAVGSKALFSVTGTTFFAGSGNACVGYFAGYSITTGNNNACVGNSAGYRYGTGSSVLTNASSCVLIGNDARPLADTPTNEIVIGDTARGHGSNTATIGNDSVTDTYLAGTVHCDALSLPGTTSQFVMGDGSIASVEGWTAPSLTNSWVNYGAGYNPAGYYKDPMGVVHLRGSIKSGTLAQSAFTLPTGYRPAYTEAFVVASSTITGSGRLDVNSNGTVVPSSPSNSNFVSLDGITFRAA